ncbi:MAG TPA: response regulator [Ktedonobacteraceae bacterium]|nr:response regulator [Ktedonobacteraceae bacterium]
MHNMDAANTMPGDGNVSMVNGTTTENDAVRATSPLDMQEKSETMRRILVVEDDPSLAQLEASYLTACHYSVAVASTGELAITALSDFSPDLVVLDLELPGGLSGWDVLQALRTKARIPVLVTTSLTQDVRKHIRSNGENRSTLDHLPKPYPMQTLLRRIKRML